MSVVKTWMVLFLSALLWMPLAQAKEDPTPKQKPTAFQVDGYKGAKFGMSEKALLATLKKEFPEAYKDLVTVEHKHNQQKVFSLRLENLIEGAGPAVVTYFMGYRSKLLVHVNVTWGDLVIPDSQAKFDDLKVAADLLTNYFQGYRFKPDSLVVGKMQSKQDILFFKGRDDKNRELRLQLSVRGVESGQKDKAGKPVVEPRSFLQLSYIADPENPDIYRIQPGAF
ncbi:conserved hypothetical protein [Magnetococcus marinus MC-1]|uniref:Uncharacterized protein n=1 Tax=Magnetococcus marinus (strain ATCC BAA-1437 / JCM 17883 / MC-1) TaxID=156889 RepID=A0L9M9_MAGMM|nr:hypothetical protein [Magnetococcus marinus]ABK44672.1 conserved hypothetical protein [Magnetococcus marinus MC-1]